MQRKVRTLFFYYTTVLLHTFVIVITQLIRVICSTFIGSAICSVSPVDINRQPEGKGLYPIFAIMSHYCICNARYTLNPKSLSMYVRARSNIRKGEEISVQYLSALSGNFKRRKKIRDEWYFDCECRRCSDPTECGSYVSALKCDSCSSGNVLPIDSLEYNSKWKCTT